MMSIVSADGFLAELVGQILVELRIQRASIEQLRISQVRVQLKSVRELFFGVLIFALVELPHAVVQAVLCSQVIDDPAPRRRQRKRQQNQR